MGCHQSQGRVEQELTERNKATDVSLRLLIVVILAPRDESVRLPRTFFTQAKVCTTAPAFESWLALPRSGMLSIGQPSIARLIR